jgi:hypothetical protein
MSLALRESAIIQLSQKYRFVSGEGADSDSELRRMCVGFNGHDKPFPAWYPYILVGGIAAVATALYVFG